MVFETKEVERKVLAILKTLEDSPEPIGSTIITKRLTERGVRLSDRAVRYHLSLMDARGLTRLIGRRDGRVITELGQAELKKAMVVRKVGSALSRIELLAFRTTYDPGKHSGFIPVNVSLFSETVTARRFGKIVELLTRMHDGKRQACSGCGTDDAQTGPAPGKKNGEQTGFSLSVQLNTEVPMRFAVPTQDKKLCAHFGHCEAFALIDTDGDGKILNETYVTPPPHEPGLLPPWIAGQGVNCVIAGGMGARAQQLFSENGVRVVTGAQGENAREVVENYLKGTLVTGANTCDH